MKFLTLFILILFLSQHLYSKDVIEKSGNCEINWTEGNVICQGESASNQNKYAASIAAKVIAQRNLLEVIKGIHIDSEVSIKDGLESSQVIRSRVEGFIKGAEIISNDFDDKTGSSIATVKIMMGKDLLEALLSDPTKVSWNERIQLFWENFSIVTELYAQSTYSSQEKDTILKLLQDMREAGNKPAEKYLSQILEQVNKQNYTGILIDISQIKDFKKAMIVKLVDKKGKEIYPSNHVSKQMLVKLNTSVGFIFGLNDGRQNQRVIDTPLELKATEVYFNRKSDIVLDDAQIHQINNLNPDLLKNAKIILVLGD